MTLARACAYLGCARARPCPIHGREGARRAAQRRDRARGPVKSPLEPAKASRHVRGYGSRWVAHRIAWIAEARRLGLPLVCGVRLPGSPPAPLSRCRAAGLMTPFYTLDHVVPVTGPTDPSFFDPLALQGLCRACDQRKRRAESVGRGGRWY